MARAKKFEKRMKVRESVKVDIPVTPSGIKSRTSTTDNPCANPKGKCPTQLFFVDGVAHLRFCTKNRKPREEVVKTPKEAYCRAKTYCGCVSGKVKNQAACVVTAMDAPCSTALGKSPKKRSKARRRR